MARQITPGNPPKIEAQQFKVDNPDFSKLDDFGDAKIKAANTNFRLYADTTIKTEAAKLFEQYKTDPMQLSNALSKLPDMLKGLPEEIQEEMNHKLFLEGVSLVQKAENNRLVEQDLNNKKMTQQGIEQSKATLSETYQNILQNHIAPADQKNRIANDIFLQEMMSLNTYADLTDHTGKEVYTETQKKAIKNIDDMELDGFKQFFDTMLLNDNNDLENSKNYYTKFILAPERFMAENYMNRETYEKAREYAKKELDRAGADIKKAKFNQSIKEATELQVENLPGRLESLRNSGQIDTSILDRIEKTNVKFNEIDPSKPELPTTMIEMLEIVNSWNRNPAPTTDADKLAILEQGTATLEALADYGQAYGLSERSTNQAKTMVVLKEQDKAYGSMLENFGRITQSFGTEIPNMREKLNYIRATNGSAWKSSDMLKGKYKVPTDAEYRKLVDLNEALAYAEDASREAIRQNNPQAYYQIQEQLRKRVAQIKYSDRITPMDWAVWEKDPEKVFLVGGISFQISGFTPDGDIITK